MRTLGIAGGSLSIAFTAACNERGLDAVEFLVTTSPGQPPAPLGKVVSGGEQARIALAITVVAAEKSELPCLVLDEADIGVGGVTADTVGRMLRRLAGRAQVICVTHAPPGCRARQPTSVCRTKQHGRRGDHDPFPR